MLGLSSTLCMLHLCICVFVFLYLCIFEPIQPQRHSCPTLNLMPTKKKCISSFNPAVSGFSANSVALIKSAAQSGRGGERGARRRCFVQNLSRGFARFTASSPTTNTCAGREKNSPHLPRIENVFKIQRLLVGRQLSIYRSSFCRFDPLSVNQCRR